MMERDLKTILFILLAFGAPSMADALTAPGQMEAFDNSNLLGQARATAPARTFIHPVMTASSQDLKGVRVESDEEGTQDYYRIGVDPDEVNARHPAGIPQGTAKKNTKLGASSTVTLKCLVPAQPNPDFHGVATSSPGPQSTYDWACNTQHASCGGNCKGIQN